MPILKQTLPELEFDDQFIYDELDLLPGERQLPMIQLMRDEALRAFQEWADKIDKAEY